MSETVTGFDEFIQTVKKLDNSQRIEAERAIYSIAITMRNDWIGNIDREKINDTGHFRKSIMLTSGNTDRYIEYNVFSDAIHAIFMEQGTSPHFPPVEALIPWVRRKLLRVKGLQVKPGSSKRIAGKTVRSTAGQESLIRGIAFCIARKISQRGTSARPTFGPAYDASERRFNAEMDAMARRWFAGVA